MSCRKAPPGTAGEPNHPYEWEPDLTCSGQSNSGPVDVADLRALLAHFDLTYSAGNQTAWRPPVAGIARLADCVRWRCRCDVGAVECPTLSFPATPRALLDLLRGFDGTATTDQVWPPNEGDAVWARDATGAWTQATCIFKPYDNSRNASSEVHREAVSPNLYLLQSTDPFRGWADDGLERRVFPMNPSALSSLCRKSVALTAEDFNQYDRKQKFWRQHRDPETVLETWEGAAVSDAGQCMVPLTHMAPFCPPHDAWSRPTPPARRHLPAVVPTTDDHRPALQRRAPWWDVIELVELTRPEAIGHVLALAAAATPQGRGYATGSIFGHSERAVRAWKVLSGEDDVTGAAGDGDDGVVKYYTHRRLLPGYACQYYENQNQNGSSCPLVISTDAAHRRIAFVYAMMGTA